MKLLFSYLFTYYICIVFSCYVQENSSVLVSFFFWEQKKLLQFLFGQVLIFLPNVGQGGLEMALIDCSGNCSQLMNTIK